MIKDIIETIQFLGAKLLKFVVDTIQRVTLLATLASIAGCLVLFFMCFFTGHPTYALLSLAGMLCFVYTNKQF